METAGFTNTVLAMLCITYNVYARIY